MSKHLDSLTDHIELVRRNCSVLANKFLEIDPDFSRILIANGYIHDNSKFYGIEWDYLHTGKDQNDIDEDMLKLAIRQHQSTNPHHPEYWGDINKMPEIYLAEMTCDWLARAQVFGTDIRSWIKDKATVKYRLNTRSGCFKKITNYTNLLLESAFK